jgi:hypothetical protein
MKAYAALAVMLLAAYNRISAHARSKRLAVEVIERARAGRSHVVKHVVELGQTRNVMLALYRCGNLTCGEIGRIVSSEEIKTPEQAFKAGRPVRDYMLDMGWITPSNAGNREFRHSLTPAGSAVARKLIGVA